MHFEQAAFTPVGRTAVIVLTLNAAGHLPALLVALAALAQQPRRVIFVDSSSTDGTAELVRDAGHVLHRIDRKAFGHGRTRNLAATLCEDCDYLIYLTQDACPRGPKWLDSLLRPMADPTVALVYGRQLPRVGAGWPERHAREFNYPATADRSRAADLARRGVKAVFCSNSFAAYRRHALVAVGGFPERLPMGEDMAVALRLLQAGHTRVYEPSACAVHSHAYSSGEELQRYFDIGTLMAMDPELSRVRVSTSGEGLRFLRAELAGALRHQGWGGVLACLVRTLAKGVGFQLGRRYQMLPAAWRRRLSMHSFFWGQA